MANTVRSFLTAEQRAAERFGKAGIVKLRSIQVYELASQLSIESYALAQTFRVSETLKVWASA